MKTTELIERFDRFAAAHPNKYLNRETVSYLIFGVLTTLANWIVYYGLDFAGMPYLLAQVIAWIAAVLFAFWTNRKYVFQSDASGTGAVMREMFKFVGARLLTFLIETALLFISVDLLGLSERLMKIPVSVITVILNYVFSKLFIFKKESSDEKENDL